MSRVQNAPLKMLSCLLHTSHKMHPVAILSWPSYRIHRICWGNYMILSTIWDKSAQVNFSVAWEIVVNADLSQNCPRKKCDYWLIMQAKYDCWISSLVAFIPCRGSIDQLLPLPYCWAFSSRTCFKLFHSLTWIIKHMYSASVWYVQQQWSLHESYPICLNWCIKLLNNFI